MGQLTVYERSSIDLAKLHHYRILKSRMEANRQKYYKLHTQVLKFANLYFDALPEAKTVIRLRREIRLATKGTPQTIAQDAITTAGYISFGTEQLYNAESHLVQAAYRMVASLVHPDRGGDPELFQLVNAAYRLKDLTFLQELYITLKVDNPFWRCRDGLLYMQQEVDRPQVSTKILQTTPEFEICRLHMKGDHKGASILAQTRLLELIVTLNAELHSLLTVSNTTGNNHDQQESSEESSFHPAPSTDTKESSQ